MTHDSQCVLNTMYVRSHTFYGKSMQRAISSACKENTSVLFLDWLPAAEVCTGRRWCLLLHVLQYASLNAVVDD